MTKEEILQKQVESEHPWVHYDDVLVCMQSYADQETESLRQQNAKLVDALKAAERKLCIAGYAPDGKMLTMIREALQP